MNKTSLKFGKREEEVVHLLMQGKSNNQIAYELGISVRTVEYHLGKVYAKLNVLSRSEAIILLSKLAMWDTAILKGSPQGESTVDKIDESANNHDDLISKWRIAMKNISRSKYFNRTWVMITIGISVIVFVVGFPVFQLKYGFPNSLVWIISVILLVWLTYFIRAFLFGDDQTDDPDAHIKTDPGHK